MRQASANQDFRCLHCRQIVSANPALSGVQSRNHCPYCLWSRHLDLHRAGDRLSACRAKMQPIGVTLKRSAKKYGPRLGGELMLIHECVECGKVAVNRIAADDFAEVIMEVYKCSWAMHSHHRQKLWLDGVQALQIADAATVRARLYGIQPGQAFPPAWQVD